MAGPNPKLVDRCFREIDRELERGGSVTMTLYEALGGKIARRYPQPVVHAALDRYR